MWEGRLSLTKNAHTIRIHINIWGRFTRRVSHLTFRCLPTCTMYRAVAVAAVAAVVAVVCYPTLHLKFQSGHGDLDNNRNRWFPAVEECCQSSQVHGFYIPPDSKLHENPPPWQDITHFGVSALEGEALTTIILLATNPQKSHLPTTGGKKNCWKRGSST